MSDVYPPKVHAGFLLSPWQPITNKLDLAHLGKLGEETHELGAAIDRCIIQGIDESEPVSGKPNRQWLQEEVADVLANIDLVIERFGLSRTKIADRKIKKKDHLRGWHSMLQEAAE